MTVRIRKRAPAVCRDQPPDGPQETSLPEGALCAVVFNKTKKKGSCFYSSSSRSRGGGKCGKVEIIKQDKHFSVLPILDFTVSEPLTKCGKRGTFQQSDFSTIF
ncbi:MAG: hypothetical protein IJY20_01350 [Clostridia bacterium]|nr:hypothetical protein [Clostridia bacterium]